jgi:hypothetical protein
MKTVHFRVLTEKVLVPTRKLNDSRAPQYTHWQKKYRMQHCENSVHGNAYDANRQQQ